MYEDDVCTIVGGENYISGTYEIEDRKLLKLSILKFPLSLEYDDSRTLNLSYTCDSSGNFNADIRSFSDTKESDLDLLKGMKIWFRTIPKTKGGIDYLHPKYNKWRIPTNAKLSDAEVKERLRQMIQYYLMALKYIQEKELSTLFIGTDTPIRMNFRQIWLREKTDFRNVLPDSLQYEKAMEYLTRAFPTASVMSRSEKDTNKWRTAFFETYLKNLDNL